MARRLKNRLPDLFMMFLTRLFSHCIDYVLDAGSGKDHNHQDNVFDEFVRKSEIPEIFKNTI